MGSLLDAKAGLLIGVEAVHGARRGLAGHAGAERVMGADGHVVERQPLVAVIRLLVELHGLLRLAAFLALLPEDHNAAFEFRNDTWFADDVYSAIQGAGAALCLSEREDNAPPPLVETAPWGYVRLRLESYSDDDLMKWARTLEATSWREMFVYFMHEPTAPAYARKLIDFGAGAKR